MSIDVNDVQQLNHPPAAVFPAPNLDLIEQLNWPAESSDPTPSVHTIETSSQNLPLWLRNADRSRWNPGLFNDSSRMYDMADPDKSPSRSEALRNCRTGHWFVRDQVTGEVRLATNGCGLRWCPKCADARARFIAHSVAAWCGTFDRPKFLTLTLRHTSAPLVSQLEYLYERFRRLRRHSKFRKYVWGGVWGLHVKRSGKDGLWHPHIHALIDSAFYPHRELKRLWRKVAPGSDIVDIRPVYDPAGASYDVAGYAACPYDMSKHSDEDNFTVYHALHGKRLCGTWGTARGIPLRPIKVVDKKNWHNIGSLAIVQSFYNDDPNARAIADAWHNHEPLPDDVTMLRLDAFIDDLPTVSFPERSPRDGSANPRSPPYNELCLFDD